MIDELEAIRTSMDDVPGPSDEVLARLRADLDRLIAGSAPAGAGGRVLRWRSRRVRLGVVALATAAAAVVAISVLPSSTGGPSPAAAAALHQLARVAAAQPAVVAPGPGQYQYTDSEDAYENCVAGASVPGNDGLAPSTTTTTPSANSGTGAAVTPSTGTTTHVASYCALVPEHRQIWIGADYSGRILETFGAPIFLSNADKAAWETDGSPSFGQRSSDTTFGPHTMSEGPGDLANLPTDPTALGAELNARKIEGGPPGHAEDFTQIGDLLREDDASPALRAALYDVAATVPGVQLLGPVANHAGTSGLGVAYTSDGVRNELIFDPTTSALIGEESVATVSDPPGYKVPAGTVLDWADYLASGIVDSLSSTPTGSVAAAPPVTCTAINPSSLPAGSMKPIAGIQSGWPSKCTGNGP